MYYIYIVRCRGGSLYTGIAADIEKRMRQHLARGAACADARKENRKYGYDFL